MNRRIKKKKQKAAYKIPKQIVRLVRRWTALDSELLFMVEFCDIENEYPKKLVKNFLRKYKRITVFLDNIEGDEAPRTDFFICHRAYGEEQFDGEYCDQHCGYSGDDFHGVYYYPISQNLYFAYNY